MADRCCGGFRGSPNGLLPERIPSGLTSRMGFVFDGTVQNTIEFVMEISQMAELPRHYLRVFHSIRRIQNLLKNTEKVPGGLPASADTITSQEYNGAPAPRKHHALWPPLPPDRIRPWHERRHIRCCASHLCHHTV